MRNILIIILLITSWPALANDKPAVNKPVIDKQYCRYLAVYQPKVDGNAEYKPGVDVHGKPVVEADLTPSVVTPPEEYSFPITIDVAKYMGVNVPVGTMAEAPIGMIKIKKDGEVTFNGKPLAGEAESALKALCTEPSK